MQYKKWLQKIKCTKDLRYKSLAERIIYDTTHYYWIQGVRSGDEEIRAVSNGVDWSQGEKHPHFAGQLGIARESCEAD